MAASRIASSRASTSAARLAQHRAVPVAHGDHRLAADVDVHLDDVRAVRAVEDEQHVVAVGIELGPLAELAGVLDRERIEAEHVAEGVDLRRARLLEVQPEELLPLAQAPDELDVEGVEDLHAAEPTAAAARPARCAGVGPR
jgi:hypothetical protein